MGESNSPGTRKAGVIVQSFAKAEVQIAAVGGQPAIPSFALDSAFMVVTSVAVVAAPEAVLIVQCCCRHSDLLRRPAMVDMKGSGAFHRRISAASALPAVVAAAAAVAVAVLVYKSFRHPVVLNKTNQGVL